MSSSRLLGLLTIFACLVASASARADDRPPPGAAPLQSAPPIHRAIVGDFGLGVVSSSGSDFEGAVTVDGAVLARLGSLELGGRGELGTGFLGNHRAGLGALAGVGFHRWVVGLDLLGEAGVHSYGGVESRESGFFDHTSGASATVPFLGLRVGVDVPFEAARRGHTRGFIGLALSLRQEPWRNNVSYTYTEGSFNIFGDDSRAPNEAKVSSAAIGGAIELGLALRVGFDIAR